MRGRLVQGRDPVCLHGSYALFAPVGKGGWFIRSLGADGVPVKRMFGHYGSQEEAVVAFRAFADRMEDERDEICG